MIKWPVHQKDLASLTVHAVNNRAAQYVNPKLIELKGEVDRSTFIIGGYQLI